MAAEEAQDTVFATAAHAAAFAGNTVALIALAEEDPTLLHAKTEDGETPAYVHCKDVLRACLSSTVECVCHLDGCTCVPLIFVTCRHHAAAAGSAVALACLGSIDVSLLLETDAEGWCVYSASPSLRLFWHCLREIHVCLCASACSITLTSHSSRNPAHTAAFYGHLSALQVKMPLAPAKKWTNARDLRDS